MRRIITNSNKWIEKDKWNDAREIINLPRVISFDEFKADTNDGKYAFVLNDPILKRVLDILSSRKKEYLIKYFTHCNNRHSVEFVISDMYDHIYWSPK